jgi:hypothetical protein
MTTKKSATPKGVAIGEIIAMSCGMTKKELEAAKRTMSPTERSTFAPLFDRVADDAAIDFLKTALAAAIADNVELTAKSDALIRAFADERLKVHEMRGLMDALDRVVAVVLSMIASPQDGEPNFYMQVSDDASTVCDAPMTTIAQMVRRALDGETFAQQAAGAALGALIRRGGRPTYRCGHTEDDCPNGCPRERGLHLVRDTGKETIQ